MKRNATAANIRGFFNRMAESGYMQGDSDELKVKKSSLTILSIPFAMAGLVWGTMYFANGLLLSGLIPFSYGVLSVLSFIYFTISKNYVVYRNSQLILILLLPFLLQISLGGFISSSAVIIWAFISPMGALMFLSEKSALKWFMSFLVVVLLAYAINDWAGIHYNRQFSVAFINVIFLLNILAVCTLIYIMLNFYVQQQEKLKLSIRLEQERSENLLLNILPAEIAAELKKYGRADAHGFETVTILFTDFKQFTEMAEKLSARELVEELNTCFEAFDGICETYRIEKIKTIGDSYMAAGGIPVPTDNSVSNTVLAALEMAEFIIKRKPERIAAGKIPFEMRVGINTGPVVAGIVGVKKFQYDIWGDTVNTASRMESGGAVGKVNISETTYLKIKDDPRFAFEYRGKLQAKGKGEVNMYFVSMNNG